jgi:hypothetical protein
VGRGIGLVLGCLCPLTRRLNEQGTKVVLQPLEAVIRTFSCETLPCDSEAQPQVRLGRYAVSQVARLLPRSLGKLPGLRNTLFGQRGFLPGCRRSLLSYRCKLPGCRGRLPGLPSKRPGFRGSLFGLFGQLPGFHGSLFGLRDLLLGLPDLRLGCAELFGGLLVLVPCKHDFSGLLFSVLNPVCCLLCQMSNMRCLPPGRLGLTDGPCLLCRVPGLFDLLLSLLVLLIRSPDLFSSLIDLSISPKLRV